jgi:CheY-like chemotaxis protein
VQSVQDASSTETRTTRGLRGHRVLLLESAAATRRAIAGQLDAFGAQVEEVPDLEHALALLRRARGLDEPFEALLVDRDNWLDGWRRLGDALAPGIDAQAWPVVVLRPFAGEEGSVDPNRPAPATLRKPVHRNLLYDRLVSAIGKKPAAPRSASPVGERPDGNDPRRIRATAIEQTGHAARRPHAVDSQPQNRRGSSGKRDPA